MVVVESMLMVLIIVVVEVDIVGVIDVVQDIAEDKKEEL